MTITSSFLPYGNVESDALRTVNVWIVLAKVGPVDDLHHGSDVIVANDAVTL